MPKLKFKGVSARVVSSSQNLKKHRLQKRSPQHQIAKNKLAEQLRKKKSTNNKGKKDFKNKKFQAGGKSVAKALFNKKDFKNKL